LEEVVVEVPEIWHHIPATVMLMQGVVVFEAELLPLSHNYCSTQPQ
jgi:hypothetical protein